MQWRRHCFRRRNGSLPVDSQRHMQETATLDSVRHELRQLSRREDSVNEEPPKVWARRRLASGRARPPGSSTSRRSVRSDAQDVPKDVLFGEEVLTQWQLVFPHAEVHRLSDAGHFVPEDAPR